MAVPENSVPRSLLLAPSLHFKCFLLMFLLSFLALFQLEARPTYRHLDSSQNKRSPYMSREQIHKDLSTDLTLLLWVFLVLLQLFWTWLPKPVAFRLRLCMSLACTKLLLVCLIQWPSDLPFSETKSPHSADNACGSNTTVFLYNLQTDNGFYGQVFFLYLNKNTVIASQLSKVWFFFPQKNFNLAEKVAQR